MDKIEKMMREIRAEEKRTGKHITYGMYVAKNYPPKPKIRHIQRLNKERGEVEKIAKKRSGGVKWTAAEENLLCELLRQKVLLTREIAELLGRTEASVACKIKTLGYHDEWLSSQKMIRRMRNEEQGR